MENKKYPPPPPPPPAWEGDSTGIVTNWQMTVKVIRFIISCLWYLAVTAATIGMCISRLAHIAEGSRAAFPDLFLCYLVVLEVGFIVFYFLQGIDPGGGGSKSDQR